MIDLYGPFEDENERLERAYETDNEGLSPLEFFEKYASEEYKQWTEEEIARMESLRQQGIRC